MPSKYLQIDDHGIARCWWCGNDPIYVEYHDDEWGQPVTNDHRLFEKICLEGFQAGLSWITILKRRDAFRKAFAEFDPAKVARFNRVKIERLVKDSAIIRHRGKIEATVNNAKRALELEEEFDSLEKFFWQFEPGTPYRFDAKRSETRESKSLSKELKNRGWRFVGPTTCYAFMQAMGLVNDHHPECHRWDVVERMKNGEGDRRGHLSHELG